MSETQTLYLVLLAAIYVERGCELIVSGRNRRAMLAAGAVEVGRRQFAVMAVFHALFPLLCGLEVIVMHRSFPGAIGIVALILALTAQGLRWWSVHTLGRRWSVRVIVPPDAPPITCGPYRFVRHPNYLAVLIEMVAVPLVHAAWISAVCLTAGNAVLLAVRMRTEERALGASYARAFAHRPRLIPLGGRRV